jgi:hypothetical protein
MISRNTGGVKRGDRTDTGDNEARPTEGVGRGGSGVRSGDDGPAGVPNADPSSIGVPDAPIDYVGEEEVVEAVDETGNTGDGGIGDLTILPASDPSLGLTDIGEVPPEDWAADTGPTKVPDASEKLRPIALLIGRAHSRPKNRPDSLTQHPTPARMTRWSFTNQQAAEKSSARQRQCSSPCWTCLRMCYWPARWAWRN